jgi:DNA-binding beta-propeller fold protein YncE
MAYDSMNFTVLNDINNPISPETGFTDVVVAGGAVYAANFDVDAILVVDPSTRNVLGDLLVRDGPIAVATYPR